MTSPHYAASRADDRCPVFPDKRVFASRDDADKARGAFIAKGAERNVRVFPCSGHYHLGRLWRRRRTLRAMARWS